MVYAIRSNVLTQNGVDIAFARKIKHNNCREEPKITLFILGKETLKLKVIGRII